MARMTLQAAYDQARQWLESNDLDRAIGLAQHLLDHYPDNLEAYRILGEAYLANRQLDRAQESFERVLRSDPENIPAHVGLGITYERQGKIDRAVAEFEQALEIKPDMAELRSQLLRLYADAWGSEHAQLRLSRAGLARLYAKGQMLPQAIGEFRQVVADHPTRFDARVALAEALWRSGQEEEAREICQEILDERPDSLKANLILGYLELASGHPEGERYWKAARDLDPYLTVARAMFDTLPPDGAEEPTIEEWDEAAWRRRFEEQQEQMPATRPMEAVTPTGTPTDEAAFEGPSWFSQPPPRPAAVPADADDGDDFLASLLSLDLPTSFPETPGAEQTSDEELDLGMKPFSIEDLGREERPAQTAPQDTSAPTEEEPQLTPFSLADLGLSEEEIAGLESLEEGQPAGAAPGGTQPARDAAHGDDSGFEDDDLGTQPFSLADLGLSEEELTGPSTPDRPTRNEGFSFEAPPRSEPALNHLEELDLGGELPDDLQPFSLDELDLGAQDRTRQPGELPPSLRPFSLDEEVAPPSQRAPEATPEESSESFDDLERQSAEPRGYSWQQPSQRLEPGFLKALHEEPAQEDVSIFAKLKNRREREPEQPEIEEPPVEVGEDEHLGLFSLDNIPLHDDEETRTGGPVILPAEPGISPQPNTIPEAIEASQMQPFSLADLGLSDEEIAALDLGATGEQTQSGAPEPEAEQGAIEASQIQPFSLADLGLSDEEIAALDLGTTEEERPQSGAPEPETVQEAIETGQMQPFSLADLGFSEEEIGALDLGMTEERPQSGAPEPETVQEAIETGQMQPFSLADLGLSDEEIAALDLGTTEEERPQSGAPEPETVQEAIETGQMQPFSLADLGLSDEEISALGLEPSNRPAQSAESQLGISEDELAGMDMGDLRWTSPEQPQPTLPETAGGDPAVAQLIDVARRQGFVDLSDIISIVGDPEAEAGRIEEIGRQLHKANVQIRDGDEVIDLEAEYAEEASSATSAAPAAEEPQPSPAEPQLTPFSLADLGLSEEEIAALDLGAAAPEPAAETEPAAPEPAAEARPSAPEVDNLQDALSSGTVQPFSLADLGLSEEEIAALDLGTAAPEPAAETEPAAPEPAAEARPSAPEVDNLQDALSSGTVQPFSLADLGLSEEEIAALDLGSAAPEPAAETEPAAPEPAAEVEPPSIPQLPATDRTEARMRAEPVEAPIERVPERESPERERTPRDTAPSETRRTDASAPPTGIDDALESFIRQLEAEPQNHPLRLSIARMSGRTGRIDLAVQQYKQLVKQDALLDEIVDDLQDLVADIEDTRVLRQLHRALGDVYSKQGRFREAMEEYSWIPPKPRGSR